MDNEGLQSVPWHRLSDAVDRLLSGPWAGDGRAARVTLLYTYLAEMRRRTAAGAFSAFAAPAEPETETKPGTGSRIPIGGALTGTVEVWRGSTWVGPESVAEPGRGPNDPPRSREEYYAEKVLRPDPMAGAEPKPRIDFSRGPRPGERGVRYAELASLEARTDGAEVTTYREGLPDSRYHFEPTDDAAYASDASDFAAPDFAEPDFAAPDFAAPDFAALEARVMAAVSEPKAAPPSAADELLAQIVATDGAEIPRDQWPIAAALAERGAITLGPARGPGKEWKRAEPAPPAACTECGNTSGPFSMTGVCVPCARLGKIGGGS